MIQIYTKPNCSYCSYAKTFMRENNIPYIEYKLDLDFTRDYIVEKFPFASTYPVILVEGIYIGGFTDLKTLYESGDLYDGK